MNFVLIPGSGGKAWYWHRLVPYLRERRHEVIAVDLPAADESAGLVKYRDTIIDSIGKRSHLVVVAQSMGAFSAPLVCDRVPVQLLVLVNAMVPTPGETMSEWFSNPALQRERTKLATRMGWTNPDFDVERDFFHDVPPDVKAEAFAAGEPAQAEKPFTEPWPLREWPDVPTRVVQARDDRFFPIEFQRRIVRERLGLQLEEVPGGHLVALSRPGQLAAKLESYLELSGG